jgi:branched-chain amino acid transport system substrate-binding protein
VLSARSAALVLALSLALTACNGGGDDGSEEPDGGSALQGPPVVLGFVNMEGSPAGSFPEATTGAQAAVDHVNDELGGVDGRPLRLETCATNGTPESSQACAQRLTSAAPSAVVGGVDLGAESSVPVITGAGIPYVTGSPTLIGELRNEGAYAFTGGVAADLLAIGQHLIEDRGVQSIHVLHADLPGLLNTAVSAAGDVFRAKQVPDVKLVAEKVDAPDFAPALTAAAEGDPEALVVVFPAQSCARIAQAAASLGVQSEIYLPGACATASVRQAAGPVLERMTFASGYAPVPADGGSAEAEAFLDRVPEAERSPLSQASFSAVLNLAVLLDGGAISSADLRAALEATVEEDNVFAHPYTCNGDQIALLPSVCNPNVRLLRYSPDGSATDVVGDWVSGAELSRVIGGGG